MKDYLKEELSSKEREMILAIIKVTARCFKNRLYQRNKIRMLPIDDIDLPIEDDYTVFVFKIKKNISLSVPLTMEEKNKIVQYVDNVLNELSLFDFKRALTFDEKLVLFLYRFKKFTENQTADFLDCCERTVRYRNESIKEKKIKYIGGIDNV